MFESRSDLPYQEMAYYYDLLYNNKDYKSEAAFIKELVLQHKKSSGIDLLDIACGTGSHLVHLKEHFNVTGTDISNEMLEICKTKIPDIELIQADMIDMRLNRQFDIITCLFSSIAYTKTLENVKKTIQTFESHLKPGGLVIIEPFLRPEIAVNGTPYMTTYDGPDIKVARLNIADIRDSVYHIDFNFLVAKRNSPVKSFNSKHELGLFYPEDIVKILKESNLDAFYQEKGFYQERGLFIGVKTL